jgi:opacity protein-like surface antigen
MSRSSRSFSVWALVCAVQLASAAIANAQATSQTPQPSEESRALMTAFYAFGDDLAPGGGAAFTFPWTRRLSVEAEASLGRDAARSSLSLLFAFPQWGPVRIYAAGGAGVQRDDFEFERDFVFETRKKTEFAVNIGAGVSIPVSNRWAVRSDFRWYNPKREWPESWRAFGGFTVAIRH